MALNAKKNSATTLLKTELMFESKNYENVISDNFIKYYISNTTAKLKQYNSVNEMRV